MDNLRRWLYNNSLSLAFFVFFAASLAGQSIAGLADFNAHRAMFSAPPLTYRQYLHTGHFADGVFTNWQAAILQLGCLIVFATWLRQKGASHSLKPNGKLAGKRGNIRRYSWLRRNSLSLAFAGLFVGSLSAHVIFGTIAYNEMQVLSGMPPVSVAAYIARGHSGSH